MSIMSGCGCPINTGGGIDHHAWCGYRETNGIVTVTSQQLKEHKCSPPKQPELRTHDWECGVCSRVWKPNQYGWLEVRGPSYLYDSFGGGPGR